MLLQPAPYLVNAVGQLAAFAMLAVSLDLVWGYLGILSLGHGLFFAIGGYVCAMHLLTHAYAVTGVVPDFMQFMGWKTLPAYWAGLTSAPYAFVLALLLARPRRLRVRLRLVPLAGQRRLLLDHQPGAGLRRDAADVPQRYRASAATTA